MGKCCVSIENLGFPRKNLGFSMKNLGFTMENLGFPIEIMGLGVSNRKCGKFQFSNKLSGKNWGFQGKI